MSASRPIDAAFFDDLFGAYERSPAIRALMRSALDERLPVEVEPYSFVTMNALEAIAQQLRLSTDALLVDLACGRGGPGMWITRATGARLIGVDFSAVAVTQARARIAAFRLQDRAEFRIGELHATGLTDAQADALLCVDSVQFAGDPRLVAQEAARVLRPGGSLVFTGWEPRETGDHRLPECFVNLDFGGLLRTAGFDEVAVTHRPDLQRRQQAVFRRALATDPGRDRAMTQLRAEAVRMLPLMPLLRRVHITAVRARR
ncbi:methyltransferase family protein [Krasilnikovia cinnamomea]|uniref:Methyltransferase family protein n=1 Tax=Krasilnikovia cinnamomea TaxID=349313 RepID=A0A4Q7ZKA2_9ACTN|nr:class I SAM-dependent methyltransferase [Krasilnikovia cinnamomea]RZU51347.1 methyltransferase family protein [Krasilnikovia cinnamomea]